MHKKKFVLALLSLFFVFTLVPAAAHAVLIVDTGEPPAVGDGGSAWFFGTNQPFAARFTTTQDYNVTSIHGYFWEGISAGTRFDLEAPFSTVGIALYADGGAVPDRTTQYFRGTAQVPNTDPDDLPLSGQDPYGWYGVTGENIFLSAGNYWVAFESDDSLGDTYYGAYGYAAPSPLEVEAFGNDNLGTYQSANFLDLPIRIAGDPAGAPTVPEPSTLILTGLGLAGLPFRKKIKRFFP